jgi:anthranilate/para-aminobenzoate synthase component I
MAFQALIEEIGIRDPLEALAALPAQPGLVFLDSAMAHPELGRWSWLAADPFARFTSVGGEAAWNGARLPGHPIDALRTILRRFPMNPGAADLPFLGGASGFFSYEAGRLFERLPQPKASRASCPEIDLAFHDCGVVFDTLEDRAFIVSTGWPEADTVSRESGRDSGRIGCGSGCSQVRCAGARLFGFRAAPGGPIPVRIGSRRMSSVRAASLPMATSFRPT